MLVAFGIGLSSAAAALFRPVPGWARLILAMSCVVAAVCLVALFGGMEGAGALVLGLAAAVLGGIGWIQVGVSLWRHGYDLEARVS